MIGDIFKTRHHHVEATVEKQQNFNDYLFFLRETMDNLSDYWHKVGHFNPHIKGIKKALHHSDPFVIYKASIAATLMLSEKSLYH